MDRSKKIKREMIITTLISVVIVAAVSYFIIFPQIKNIIKIKNKIEKQRIELAKRYVQGQNLKKLSSDMEMVEDSLEKLEKVYIKQEEALEFITDLENIAEKNNISQKIDLLSLEESRKLHKGYFERQMHIYLNGKYSNLLSYLADMETLRYYINIQNTEVSSQVLRSGSSVNNDININIKTNIYWKAEDLLYEER